MERQSSVFGKLRARANSNSGVDASVAQDEWYIPYTARPSLPKRESGIGLSPVPVRSAHNSLLSSVFSPTLHPQHPAPDPLAESSRQITRPSATPANSYFSTALSTQRPMPRRTGTIVKSPSYSSIADAADSNFTRTQRLPSSSSVPTGLVAPKMLFSPMEREMRGGAFPAYPDHLQQQSRFRTPPRQRTVSAPRPSRNPFEYRAEARKWAVPTMCDMFVFPRPNLYPHDITPPASPEVNTKRYSLTAGSGSGSSDDRRVIEDGQARLREREQWAELIKRRGRSLSFGGQASPPLGAPVIGNVRARSREASRSRSNSMVRRDSRETEGRKRSASFGSMFTSRQSSMTRKNSEKSSFFDVRSVRKPIPKSFGFVNAASSSSTNRRPGRPSGESFSLEDHYRDVGDPSVLTRPTDSPRFRQTHGYSKSDPGLLNHFTRPGPADSRYPTAAIPAGRSLHFKQPTVAEKGGVVIIGSRSIGGRTSSGGGGSYRPPAPLDLSKPLPALPDEAKSPVLPETGPFFPLSEEIGIAISPGMRSSDKMENTVEVHRFSDPRTEPSPTSPSSPLTPRTGRLSDGGSATARAFLAKQHQRARTKRAFQSPAQAPAAYRGQRREVSSPLSASTTASSETAFAQAASTSDSPRRRTALEEAISRSRAASVSALDQQDADVAKSKSHTRPRTAEHLELVRDNAPPRISINTPSTASISSQRGLMSPPLAYPITTMPSPRTVFSDDPNTGISLSAPQRPDMPHSDTAASKVTVYTDASEGWSRAGSGRSTPLSGLKPRLSETPPSDTPSPQQSMDERDFHGLFFRTPSERNGSFSVATPLHERYAPPRSSSVMPRVIHEQAEPIGLGYGLENQAQRLGPQPEASNSPRRPSDGSGSTEQIATPVIIPDAQQKRSPYVTVVESSRSLKTQLHERRNSTTTKLMGPFDDGRPVTPESMTSRSPSEDDDAEGSLETHGTVMPIGMDGAEFPFPQASTENSFLSATATNATFDGKRRRSSISPHLSPDTFGIISQPAPSTLDRQHTQQQQQQQQQQPSHRRSISHPFNPSYSLSPYAHVPLLTTPRGSISRSPQPDALSPTLGVEASPIPDGNPRHSAAVSFFDDFPSPPALPSRTMMSASSSFPQRHEKHASAFGQLVTGPPGAGKSTYCYGLHQFLTAIGRPVHIINLDPAVPSPNYPCSVSITELITLESVQSEFKLGPNGAMLYCVEYLEANFDWLVNRLDEVLEESGGNGYVVFDTPGQAEIWTNHDSLKNVVGKLMKMDYRLAAIHLSDAHYITDASKFISVTLLALRAMLQMEMPHVNVLSKIDLLSTYGELPFDLSYYTEVQDMSYLLARLNSEPRAAKFGKLNKAMVELVEEFGLVGFETLAVEDKSSMMKLLQLVDKMTGYIFVPSASSDLSRDPATANAHALFSSAMGAKLGSDVRDVQERWLDNKDAWDEWEKERWKKEGEMRARLQGDGGEHGR